MTDTQLTQTVDPAAPVRLSPDLLDEILWLARDAQERLPRNTLGDRGYVLGQRNTYARAAGLVAARDTGEDPVLIADRIVHALADGNTDLAAIRSTTLTGIPRPARRPVLDWIGPKAFDAQCGDVPGTDQDYGVRWGDCGNQRISLRREPGASTGMLYAYDPVWDEYALIRHSVPADAVTDVFLQALRRDEHLPLELFVRLLDTRLTAPTPDPAGTALQVEP